jgi:hypothetical protein
MNNKFNFQTITKEDFISRKDLLREIKDGEISGVIVKDFFSKSDLNTLVHNYLTADLKSSNLPLNQGITYPTVFAHVRKETNDDPVAIKNYFLNCEQFRNNFKEDFKVDAAGIIQQAFESVSGGRHIEPAIGIDNNGRYPFATFRNLNPDTGEMTLHCGLYFYELVPEFYKHLHTIVGNDNQLSYFVLLQKPEIGGEMTIFDVTREEAIKKIDDLQLESKKGEILHIEKNVDHIHLTIEDGDLLVFDGGTIWHRIEIVKGNKNRITLGGFIGFTKDNNAIYYWS